MKKLSILCCLLPLFAIGQDDFQLWSKVELGYKINKKVSVELTEGFRLRENLSLPSKTFTDFKVTYKHNKKARIGMGYRFIQSFNLAQDIRLRHRWYVDVALRKKINRCNFSFRSRVQSQKGFDHLERYYRGKISASYNIRKTPLEPTISIESFLNLQSPQFDKFRYTAALSYPLHKKVQASLYYRVQQEINVSFPNTFYILGAGVSYDF